MKIQAGLDSLRSEVDGCKITAFGDLTSGLILRSSAAGTVPRETLDRLCEKAVWCFHTAVASDEIGAEETGNIRQTAIVFSTQSTQVFARNPSEPNDVICAELGPAQSLEGVLERLQGTAEMMAGVSE